MIIANDDITNYFRYSYFSTDLFSTTLTLDDAGCKIHINFSSLRYWNLRFLNLPSSRSRISTFSPTFLINSWLATRSAKDIFKILLYVHNSSHLKWFQFVFAILEKGPSISKEYVCRNFVDGWRFSGFGCFEFWSHFSPPYSWFLALFILQSYLGISMLSRSSSNKFLMYDFQVFNWYASPCFLFLPVSVYSSSSYAW